MLPVALFRYFFKNSQKYLHLKVPAGVVDVGGKFTAGVIDPGRHIFLEIYIDGRDTGSHQSQQYQVATP
jgi:hypothetical protein